MVGDSGAWQERTQNLREWAGRNPSEHLFQEAACLTVVPTQDTGEIMAVFGIPAGAPRVPLSGIGPEPHVSVTPIEGRRSLLAEVSGAEALYRRAAAKLSGQGRAATVTWNVNCLVLVLLCDGGEEVASLQLWGEPPGLPPQVLEEIDPVVLTRPDELNLTAVLLLEEFTGARLTRQLTSNLNPAWFVPQAVPA